jgi:hypothetical protein
MTERVDAFLRRLEHLSIDDLTVLALGPADPDERDRLLDRIDAAAKAAGRLEEVDEAADRAAAILVHAFSFRSLEPTWFGLNWGRSLARPVDRAVLLQAVEDGAMAAVVADLVPDDAEALADPFERAASMVGTATPANPRAGRISPNVVRIAWVVGAFGWVVLSAQVVLGLVDDILRQIYDSWFF